MISLVTVIHKDQARHECLTSGEITPYATDTFRNSIACQGVDCNLQAAEVHVLPPPTARQPVLILVSCRQQQTEVSFGDSGQVRAALVR